MRPRRRQPEPIQTTAATRYPAPLSIYRAKTQEAAQTDGLISVKFVDASGTETGSAFDVYAFADKSATDMRNYLPLLDTGEIVLVVQIGSDWYLLWTPVKKGTASDTVTPQTSTDSIFGAAMNPIGQW